jgi:outer membrane lipoprotein-sorting protein
MKYTLITLLMLIAAFPSGSAQQSEYPMMDKIAQKVIEKYQKSSCEDLKAQKEQPPDPQQAAMKQKAVAALKNDPKMREQFLNKIAGPIANKMFECGMVP